MRGERYGRVRWLAPPAAVGVGTRRGCRGSGAGQRGGRPQRGVPHRRVLAVNIARDGASSRLAPTESGVSPVALGRGRVRTSRLPAADPLGPASRPCPREGAGRRHSTAAGHHRRRGVQAAAGAARSRPAGHGLGRRTGRRLHLRRALRQFQRFPEGVPDRGWQRPPARHHRGHLARRPTPGVGGYLPAPHGAHPDERWTSGHPQTGHHPRRRHRGRAGGGGVPPAGGPAKSGSTRRTTSPSSSSTRTPARCCAASATALRWAPPATSRW